MIKRKSNKKVKLSILMPVKNEDKNLEIVLRLFKPLTTVPYEILVIYDNINDNSIPVIKKISKEYKEVKGILNNTGSGVVNAIKCGINKSQGEYFLITPADEFGSIFLMPSFLACMDKYDFVNASRYIKGAGTMGDQILKHSLSYLINKLYHLFTRYNKITDYSCGIKMFNRKVLSRIAIESNPIGWAFAVELSIKACIEGFKIKEIPYVSLNRLYNCKTSFSFRVWSKEYARWFLWGIKQSFLNKNSKRYV
jgi:glycosyltransferase involved in cell wall biosynthesis